METKQRHSSDFVTHVSRLIISLAITFNFVAIAGCSLTLVVDSGS
uniref:Uncharacterized protein n=1 Tax=Arundo donax TaxID=35708 RepID=A0A0A9DCN7_ARUDO